MPVQVAGLASGVESVATSATFSCAVVNGTAECWGSNSSGQLGDGTTTNRLVPVQVAGLPAGVEAVALTGSSSCALVNGGVWCWGDNSVGQLGNNNATGSSSTKPVQVSGLTSGVQALAAGYGEQVCALVNGGVNCWGDNFAGQLGNNTTTNSLVPVQVSGLTSGVQAISTGLDHSCALVNGGVQCWGNNGNGNLGNNNTNSSTTPVATTALNVGLQAISAGYQMDCALVNGGVECWGQNAAGTGELGNNTTAVQNNPYAQQVTGLTSGVQVIASGGGQDSCAIVNGGVQCWGVNNFGQLGNNSTANSPVPVSVVGLGSGGEAVAMGSDHTCALVNGGVQCWGHNSAGQLGNNATVDSHTPVAVYGLTSGVQQIAAGFEVACALKNGGVKCWGTNQYYLLGNGSGTGVSSSVPVQVTGLTSGVQAIAIGGLAACAIQNGGVVCWGTNTDGEVGNNTTAPSSTPAQVYGLTSGAQLISADFSSNCALVNGTVNCWGSQNAPQGQLGNNTASGSSAVPVAVSAMQDTTGYMSGVQSLVGGNHNCALANGYAQCWGQADWVSTAMPAITPILSFPAADPGLPGLLGLPY
jgi:alpha-tubulin suppressor-like RCC1 family protein